MQVTETRIPDVKIFTPKKHGDHRGFFSETYNAKTFAELGVDLDFVQDNHSLSAEKNVLRGLHFQLPPYAQDKLVRCIRGAILDVAVDIRKSSPTYGKHIMAEISAENWAQILVPKGFAHGFVTLEPNTEVIYKVTDYYAPDHDRGILWNDPALEIDWSVNKDQVIISDKDRSWPYMEQAEELFD